MKWLPVENITYRSSLDKETLFKRLLTNDNTGEPYPVLGIRMQQARVYTVSIDKDTFAMQRRINYRNSFLPQIRGVIQQNASGLEIQVKMRLPLFAMVFMVIWFVVLFFIFFSTAFTAKNVMALPLLGLMIFGYALTMIGFKIESQRSKKDLQQILDAEILEEETV